MRKSRLASVYPFDFELLGIVSSAKEYRLAWHLNQLQLFHLVKNEDIRIDFSDGRQIHISNLMEETDFSKIYLLRNKLAAPGAAPLQYLLSELQQFDYLLKISHQANENWTDDLLLKLKDVEVIDYVLKIDVDKLKMKDNLLF